MEKGSRAEKTAKINKTKGKEGKDCSCRQTRWKRVEATMPQPMLTTADHQKAVKKRLRYSKGKLWGEAEKKK